jgi:phage baseplate assembly protein W
MSGFVNETLGDEGFWDSVGPVSPSTTTSGRLLPTPRTQDGKHVTATENEKARTEGMDLLHVRLARLTSSPGASPARAPAAPVNAKGSGTRKPFCGASSLESLAFYDPASSSLRTSRPSLASNEEACGEPWSGTWPRSASMRNGSVFERATSVAPTVETGCFSLLGTPTARDWKGPSGRSYADEVDDLPGAMRRLLPTPNSTERGGRGQGSIAKGGGEMLNQSVERLLPTPVASLANYEEELATWEPRRQAAAERHGNNGIGHPLPLTLKTLDVESPSSGAATSPPSAGGKPSTGLRLSPWFVEWMIGAPPGWSDSACPLSAMVFKCRWDESSAST